MKIKKTIGAGLISLGLVAGMTGLVGATSGTIETTGPDSINEIEEHVSREVEVENDNDLRVNNMNIQRAETGEAEVEDNTTAEDVGTGGAANTAGLMVDVEIANEGSGIGEMVLDPEVANEGGIETTGPESHNEVEFSSRTEIEIENENDLHINTFNTQTAVSGDAEVEDNTTAGNAITGDASNDSSVSMSFTITN
jgi:hypothetical protein